MRHAMSQTKEKTLQSVAFRLKNRATSQAWSSWVAMWRDVTAARARLLGIFSALAPPRNVTRLGHAVRGGKHVQQSATAFVAPWPAERSVAGPSAQPIDGSAQRRCKLRREHVARFGGCRDCK